MWKRTGKDEFPEDGIECAVYFYHTGFSKSKFNWSGFENIDGEIDEKAGKVACFSDRGGYLGDEDVLWMPIGESQSYYNNIASIPEDYLNDKSFKKWDDPEKIYRYMKLREDLLYIRNPNNEKHYVYFELFIPKNTMLGIISPEPWENDGILGEGEYVYQCIYNNGKNKEIVYISPDRLEEES